MVKIQRKTRLIHGWNDCAKCTLHGKHVSVGHVMCVWLLLRVTATNTNADSWAGRNETNPPPASGIFDSPVSEAGVLVVGSEARYSRGQHVRARLQSTQVLSQPPQRTHTTCENVRARTTKVRDQRISSAGHQQQAPGSIQNTCVHGHVSAALNNTNPHTRTMSYLCLLAQNPQTSSFVTERTSTQRTVPAQVALPAWCTYVVSDRPTQGQRE